MGVHNSAVRFSIPRNSTFKSLILTLNLKTKYQASCEGEGLQLLEKGARTNRTLPRVPPTQMCTCPYAKKRAVLSHFSFNFGGKPVFENAFCMQGIYAKGITSA